MSLASPPPVIGFGTVTLAFLGLAIAATLAADLRIKARIPGTTSLVQRWLATAALSIALDATSRSVRRRLRFETLPIRLSTTDQPATAAAG